MATPQVIYFPIRGEFNLVFSDGRSQETSETRRRRRRRRPAATQAPSPLPQKQANTHPTPPQPNQTKPNQTQSAPPRPAGRAEPVRLALAAKGVRFQEVNVDYGAMKSDRSAYPFAQCPRLVDDTGLSMVQTPAILRHLARTLYPMLSLADAVAVDEIIEGVEALKEK